MVKFSAKPDFSRHGWTILRTSPNNPPVATLSQVTSHNRSTAHHVGASQVCRTWPPRTLLAGLTHISLYPHPFSLLTSEELPRFPNHTTTKISPNIHQSITRCRCQGAGPPRPCLLP